MKLASWSSEMLLGVPEMDKAHESFLLLLNQAAEASESDFPEAFRHIERDFWAEEQLMERIDYPGLHAHREQHARILETLHRAVPAVLGGDVTMGRKAMELLPRWFMFHLSTMDTALAFALDVSERESDQSDEAPGQMAM